MEKKSIEIRGFLAKLLAFKVCQQRLSLAGLEGSGGHSATGVHTESVTLWVGVSLVMKGGIRAGSGHSVPAGPGRYCKRFDRK